MLRLLPLAILAALVIVSHLPSASGLYFYLDPNVEKCFYEELPNDTVVVGHYMAELWDQSKQEFIIDQQLGIQITVKEVKENHIVTSTRGPPEGKFAFTSHEPGDHQICLSTAYSGKVHGEDPTHHASVRVHLDVIIGEAKPDNSHKDRAHIHDLASRVRELNEQMRDIRKEQEYQREREKSFRDLSESVNSKVVFYSLVQAAILVGAALWQLSHLKTYFNEKKMS